MKRMVMIWVISLGVGSVAKSDDIFRQGWSSIHDGQLLVKLQLITWASKEPSTGLAVDDDKPANCLV